MSPAPRRRAPRPKSPDGRAYPAHLRRYEPLDDELLALVGDLEPVTFDRLSSRVGDAGTLAVLPRWLASARWRGLVDESASRGGQPRSYRLAATAAPGARRAPRG
jgi:hypothetical protein